MTDKEFIKIQLVIVFVIGLFIGMFTGMAITEHRMKVEIRNDQVSLKIKVAKIEKDKAKFDDLTRRLIILIEDVKLERQRLYKLQLKLSKGEAK